MFLLPSTDVTGPLKLELFVKTLSQVQPILEVSSPCKLMNLLKLFFKPSFNVIDQTFCSL